MISDHCILFIINYRKDFFMFLYTYLLSACCSSIGLTHVDDLFHKDCTKKKENILFI